MSKAAKVIRAIKREGFGFAGLAHKNIVIRLPRVFGSKRVALAAAELKRWPLALKHWKLANLKRLSIRELELYTRTLLSTRGWDTAAENILAAQASGKNSLVLELQLAEAMWRRGDQAGLQRARAAAIALLPEATPAQISLINNDHQVIDIDSRMRLLVQVEKYFDEIQQRASLIEVTTTQPKAYMYWDSGFESAPALVKACFKQAKRVYGEDLVALTRDNIQKFAPLSSKLDRVAKLWPAQYSDLLRSILMASRGGVWLDATIYTTENSLNETKYLKGDLFVFNYNGPRIANWFMVAKAGSYQARMISAAMDAYWSRNRRLKNYFIYHDMFEVLYHLDEQFKRAFESSKHIHPADYLKAQSTLLFNKVERSAFDDLLAKAPIQKLTYKPGKKNQGAGTLYRQLCQQA